MRSSKCLSVSRPCQWSIALGVVVALSTGPAMARGCFEAAGLIAEKRWAEAEARLHALIGDAACEANGDDLRYSLAFVIEQQAAADPERACEAAAAYEKVAESSTQAVLISAARGALERVGEVCAQGPEPEGDTPPGEGEDGPTRRSEGDGPQVTEHVETASSLDRTSAWGWTASAVGAAALGGTLLYFGVQADATRAEARRTWMDPDVPEAEAQAAGRTFEGAAARATLLGLAGWAALAVGVGLGVGATLQWLDDDDPSLAIGPGGIGMSGRF